MFQNPLNLVEAKKIISKMIHGLQFNTSRKIYDEFLFLY